LSIAVLEKTRLNGNTLFLVKKNFHRKITKRF